MHTIVFELNASVLTVYLSQQGLSHQRDNRYNTPLVDIAFYTFVVDQYIDKMWNLLLALVGGVSALGYTFIFLTYFRLPASLTNADSSLCLLCHMAVAGFFMDFTSVLTVLIKSKAVPLTSLPQEYFQMCFLGINCVWSYNIHQDMQSNFLNSSSTSIKEICGTNVDKYSPMKMNMRSQFQYQKPKEADAFPRTYTLTLCWLVPFVLLTIFSNTYIGDFQHYIWIGMSVIIANCYCTYVVINGVVNSLKRVSSPYSEANNYESRSHIIEPFVAEKQYSIDTTMDWISILRKRRAYPNRDNASDFFDRNHHKDRTNQHLLYPCIAVLGSLYGIIPAIIFAGGVSCFPNFFSSTIYINIGMVSTGVWNSIVFVWTEPNVIARWKLGRIYEEVSCNINSHHHSPRNGSRPVDRPAVYQDSISFQCTDHSDNAYSVDDDGFEDISFISAEVEERHLHI
eukprot:scaffold39860_cov57-Attheya_sp.AAC.2